MIRKLRLQQWTHFCTFTYDSNKLTEEEFKEKFLNCLRHLVYLKILLLFSYALTFFHYSITIHHKKHNLNCRLFVIYYLVTEVINTMLDNSNIKLITPNEIDSVMEIINDAKELLKQNSLQWQQGYPNKDTMLNDIINSHLYGYYIDDYLVGVVALIPGIDENYLKIEDGSWINYPSEKDLTIHRIAIRNEYHNKKI